VPTGSGGKRAERLRRREQSRQGGPRPKAGTKVCESCIDRDAVNMLGVPRYLEEFGVSMAVDCEECEGSGRASA
jgi:hypothetical protein